MLKIWLDDIRPAPDETWTHVKNGSEFLDLLTDDIFHSQEEIEVSFDHDLGDKTVFNGYHLAGFFEKMAGHGKIFNIVKWHIHSANPVGRKNIQMAMESFDRIKAKKEN